MLTFHGMKKLFLRIAVEYFFEIISTFFASGLDVDIAVNLKWKVLKIRFDELRRCFCKTIALKFATLLEL